MDWQPSSAHTGKNSDVTCYFVEGWGDDPPGVECVDCLIGQDQTFTDPVSFLEHIRKHVEAGHLVPRRIIEGNWFGIRRLAIVHQGLRPERQHDGSSSGHREAAFAKQWAKQCEPVSAVNDGNGTLQGLMNEKDNPHYVYEITQRDATIVATVIQWLGTNCGMEFLGRALRDCGYELEKKKARTSSV